MRACVRACACVSFCVCTCVRVCVRACMRASALCVCVCVCNIYIIHKNKSSSLTACTYLPSHEKARVLSRNTG